MARVARGFVPDQSLPFGSSVEIEDSTDEMRVRNGPSDPEQLQQILTSETQFTEGVERQQGINQVRSNPAVRGQAGMLLVKTRDPVRFRCDRDLRVPLDDPLQNRLSSPRRTHDEDP